MCLLPFFLLLLSSVVVPSTTGFSVSTTPLAKTKTPSTTSTTKKPRILVLGGTGFVGQAVVEQLDKFNIDHVTASRQTGVDLTSPEAAPQLEALARGCTAVISTVGAIGTDEDERVGAGAGMAAQAAAQAGCQRFVVIGNDPRVRDFTKNAFLQGYAKGKEQAERIIKQEFPNAYTIIQPTFIYGGDDFSLTPPRVPSTVGQVAEDVLGLYPLQAASDALPGMLGVAAAAPVSRERVAAAAVNAALGIHGGELELSTRDAIIQAASKRPRKQSNGNKKNIQTLKQIIYDLGDCQGEEMCLQTAFDTLEEIELLNQRKPATDPLLNGRWDFCFDIEADIGTGLVKDILEGSDDSPIKPLLNIQDLHMIISEANTKVTILMTIRALSVLPMKVELTTKLHAVEDDPTGTQFQEQFQGLKVMGMALPVPESWQQSRPLEFSYLDEDMLIARGNGGEPHYLKR